jgi:hypothetical protein
MLHESVLCLRRSGLDCRKLVKQTMMRTWSLSVCSNLFLKPSLARVARNGDSVFISDKLMSSASTWLSTLFCTYGVALNGIGAMSGRSSLKILSFRGKIPHKKVMEDVNSHTFVCVWSPLCGDCSVCFSCGSCFLQDVCSCSTPLVISRDLVPNVLVRVELFVVRHLLAP